MRRFLTALALMTLAVAAHATTRYIAQTAGTFSGGTACNGHTAITPATFNGITNSPGDVNYVCGTITVAQSTTGLTVNGSGTSGSPISIIFDSGAIMKSPEWPADGTSGAIDVSGSAYVVINGQGTSAGGGSGGIIEATLNGDPGATCLGGTCTLHGDSNCVEGSTSSTNITVEGLSCIDMYVATQPNPGGGTCIYSHGNISGWVIQNNFMHDAGWCVSLQYDSGPSNGVTIANNQIYNIDHGIALGGPSASQTLENVNVYGNNIHDYSNWDTPSDSWHHDGIHIWGDNNNASDTITGVNIYNNKFGGCIGQNVTAHIFIENNSGGTSNVKVYNNSLIDTCSGNDTNGLFAIGGDSGFKFYNNTLIGTAADVCAGVSSGQNVTFINNVMTGCAQLIYQASGGTFLSGGLHNNIYANCSGSNCFAFPGGYTTSFAAWQSYTGQDASPSEYASSAGLNSSGVPQSGSATINNAANLTGLGITTLNSDITSSARPSSGAWTIGSYNYLSGASYSWTPTVVGSGTVAGTNSASGSYSSGTTIGPLTATADTGYTFTGWSAVSGSAACTGTTNPCASFSLAANSAATATFTVDSYTLTVSKIGAGTGALAGTNCSSGSYPSGTTVTCTETYSPGSVFTGWSGACSGMGTCSLSLTSNQTITATFVPTTAQELNLDDSLTGWTICTLPGCNPGGVNVPASTTQTINNATPSVDGESMLLSETTIAISTQTNALFYHAGSGCDTCTNFVDDSWVYVTNIAVSSAIEHDSAEYNLTNGRMYMWGHQCLAGGNWQIANDSSSWTSTSVPCSLTGNAWHHIVWTEHIVFGDTSCSGVACDYHDLLTVDGTTYTVNMTEPSEALPGTYPSALVDQFQLDIGPTTTATTLSNNIDEVNFSGYIPASDTVLTVSTAGSGTGTISGSNCASGSYPTGTSITCTQSPGVGSTFAGWSGGICSGTGSCSFSLSSTSTVTATFNLVSVPSAPAALLGSVSP